jgi:hypothetical protein
VYWSYYNWKAKVRENTHSHSFRDTLIDCYNHLSTLTNKRNTRDAKEGFKEVEEVKEIEEVVEIVGLE